jgi:L-2-hydroxyglutarate oxidase LhgO
MGYGPDKVPLIMEGRTLNEPIAATKIDSGTDVNFGALTRMLLYSIFPLSRLCTLTFHEPSLARLISFTLCLYLISISDDPEKLKEWIPLIMEGRTLNEPIAATKIDSGTKALF